MSHFFAFVPLGLLAVSCALPKLRGLMTGSRRRLSKEAGALLALLLLAAAVRVPFLAAPTGLMTSDDAVPALMGKHIAEGRVPPVCYYGQLYMGSLASHLYAVLFRAFGYSILALKCASLFIYLAFIVLQFVFLREVFSPAIALAAAFSYALPIGPLVPASLDNTSAYPLVLLLGGALLFLAHRVADRDEARLVPVLGFIAGLSFWTHQVTAGFILTSLLVVAPKFRLRIRPYATFLGYGLLGFLPQVLVEVFNGFPLLPFLTSGEKAVGLGKLRSAAGFVGSLLSSHGGPEKIVLAAFVVLGLVVAAAPSIRKKSVEPRSVFAIGALVFILIYVFSSFGNIPVIRYFYPFYVLLPALLLAPLRSFKRLWRNLVPLGLVAVIFFLFNLGAWTAQSGDSRERHGRNVRITAAMEETGERYWLSEYWTAYLLTAISGEKLIVDSYTVNRYRPYSLAYWNGTRADNYVLLFKDEPEERDRSAGLESWLKALGVGSKQRDVQGCRLVYDLETRFRPRIYFKKTPPHPPALAVDSIETADGFLRLVFRNPGPGRPAEFWLAAEVPGFSSAVEPFSVEHGFIGLDLPYPIARVIPIRYSLSYSGVNIPASSRELSFTLPESAPPAERPPVVFLRGVTQEVEFMGKTRRVCEKEAAVELNPRGRPISGVRLYLSSPFDFRSWRWYGEYAQSVSVGLNGSPLGEFRIEDGENLVRVALPQENLKPAGNILSLRFRYQTWTLAYPLWRVAALLEKVEVDETE